MDMLPTAAHAMAPPTPGASGQGSNGSSACLACRKIKMKCHLSPDSARCERCTRKSLDCIFQSHRRGRKLGTRLSVLHSGSRKTPENVSGATRSKEADQSVVDAVSRDLEQPENSRKFWTDSDGFQPPSLLNKQASGNFSLQNVLSTSVSGSGQRPVASVSDSEDPICKGLINDAISKSLYEGFMRNQNPFISQLDSILHTFEYVRSSSSFLFSAVLSAAAKALNPSLHPRLRDHAEELFSIALRRGVKSPEVVQAVLILTYWKEPDDTRAFVNVGLAVRIAVELGWHKLEVRVPPSTSQSREERYRRNIERTWLVLFVYDRSICMQTGSPWMIQRSHFIESTDDWISSPIASSNDALLCAFVSLRLLTSDIPELLHPQNGNHRDHSHRTRPLVKAMKDQIDRWKRRWMAIAVKECCHSFLVEFYGTHTLLLLFSLPLQAALAEKRSHIDMEVLWISYSAALRMLELVVDDTNQSFLYFAQDSVHVMIAYAAVFLIKLLLSVPKSLRGEISAPLLDALCAASHAFSHQAAPLNTGSALQSAFLTNVVTIAAKASQRSSTHHTLESVAQPHRNASVEGRSHGESAGGPRPTTLTVEIHGQTAPESRGYERTEEQNHDLSNTPQSQEFNFFDEEMWSTMFASAGFDINEGIFLPEAGS